MDCICADGTSIPPLIIFKDENICKSWLSKELLEGWHVSCNSKGWTSNVYGVEWLKKCFEPATHEKVDRESQLLICDGHDSHISADFIRHCIANDIIYCYCLLIPHICYNLSMSAFFPH